MASQYLTKSRYVAGLQCSRRLWLIVHEPLPYLEPAAGSPTDVGQAIGRKARLLFPGGVQIGEEPWRHAEAVARTASLMNDEQIPAIFEAAFEFEGVRIRVDVLERLARGNWGLREVKSSSGVKDHHLDDVALQTYVLRGSGVAVSSIEVLHVNTAYERGPNGICWQNFFARVDVADAVRMRLADLPRRLAEMRACLDNTQRPHVEPAEQCKKPYRCEFLDQCTADKPADWIEYLPRLTQARKDRLKTLGIESISAIPAEFPLTAQQVIIRDVAASGIPYVAPDLGHLLAAYGPPACYLDFEAMGPPIPLYEGTRPYQAIPFQWSLHATTVDGGLHHREFLADGAGDPRRQFAETLIEALETSDAPIIVYSAYEQTTLRGLAARFPDLGGSLAAIAGRLMDLLIVVRNAVHFPEFNFGNSIKSVAPALCPGFGYDDLEGVADGAAASAAFLQLASGYLADPDEVGRLRAALLAYCERDTLAMVQVHRALIRLVPR